MKRCARRKSDSHQPSGGSRNRKQVFRRAGNQNECSQHRTRKSIPRRKQKRPNVVTLPSGLQYEVITEGTGKKAQATDQVKCHYEGTLIDGTLFRQLYQTWTACRIRCKPSNPGWVEALQLMPEGSKWKLFIPSELAYGAQGAGEMIPPHSTLVFEVELIEVL